MKTLWIAFAALLIVSCAQEDKTQAEAREKMDRIMATHDEIMPLTSGINERIKKLEIHADSTAQGQAYRDAIVELEGASTGMFDWMKSFSETYGDVVSGTQPMDSIQLSGLDEELRQVEELKALYDRSFKRADSLIALK